MSRLGMRYMVSAKFHLETEDEGIVEYEIELVETGSDYHTLQLRHDEGRGMGLVVDLKHTTHYRPKCDWSAVVQGVVELFAEKLAELISCNVDDELEIQSLIRPIIGQLLEA